MKDKKIKTEESKGKEQPLSSSMVYKLGLLRASWGPSRHMMEPDWQWSSLLGICIIFN